MSALGAHDRDSVTALASTVEAADGVQSLSEATMLRVTAGTSGDFEHVVHRGPDGDIVAFAHVEGISTGEPAAEIAVHPDHRRRGLGRGLAEEVLRRYPTCRFWAHGWLPAGQALSRSMGMSVVRELWRMSRPRVGLSPTDPAQVKLPEGFSWRTFSPDSSDDEQAWLTVNAAAFADHPEQGRLTLDDLRARMGEPWFDPEGLFFIVDDADSRVAAFHWTKIAEPGGPGEVYVVGVDPAYQGRGLGSAATALGLAHLAGKKVPSIDLYVDGDNTAAIATYRAAGFERSALDVQVARVGAEQPEIELPSAQPRSATSVTTVTSSVKPRRAPDSRFTPLPLPEAGGEELPSDRFLDREVSWLAFNERVMQLAEDPTVPLLERVNFLSIFASNLDEFFMVRVAGLKRRIATGLAVRSASGLEPRELLDRIHTVSTDLQQRHAAVFRDDIVPALEAEDIHIVHWEQLGSAERERLSNIFDERLFPILTPLAVDPAHPFPYISGLSLNLAVVLVNRETGNEHFARLKIPSLLPRLMPTSTDHDDELYTARFVPVEEVISAHLDRLFPGMEVRERFTFRVTRNEDLEVEEDDAENLLTALEKELTRRRFGPPVRLEVDEDMSEHVMALLTREMQINPPEVRRLPTPLDLRGLGPIADLERTELKYPGFVPRTHEDLARVETAKAANMFAAIRAKDVLVQHPYDSFSTSVQAFIEQAAADPKVLAIKQTLYRTSGDSPIVDALIDAADAGKQVLAVIEIKARFDEQNNIDWARKLEQAGVHVVYGIVGLKTHCKLSLVVRNEHGGIVRYCHIGTGNYHPKTARLYEDYGLFTRDPVVAEDMSKLFNELSGWAPSTTYDRLLVAPRTVRLGLLERIEHEIANAEEGRQAYVGIKLNSIVDETIIDALYRASQAGVNVDVLVRGICALRPGVPGMSENIRVRSILGRFLEHSRVYLFGPRDGRTVFIGSADMMHRNLDRRVEALVRITDPRHVDELSDLMALGMSDTTASWHLGGDGRWARHHLADDGTKLDDMQFKLIAEHASRRKRARSR